MGQPFRQTCHIFTCLGAIAGGGGVLIPLIWEIATKGDLMLDARAAPEPVGPQVLLFLILWSVCAIYTGIYAIAETE